MPEKEERLNIETIEAKRDSIVIGNLYNGSQRPENRRKYYVFFSCEHVNDCKNAVQDCEENSQLSNGSKSSCRYHAEIKSRLPEWIDIEFKGGNDFSSVFEAFQEMNILDKSWLFVINSHKKVNEKIAYFLLGYALGKGIKILEFYDGHNQVVLPEDVKIFPFIKTRDLDDFVKKIGKLLANTEPAREYDNKNFYDRPFGSWDTRLSADNSRGDLSIPFV